MACWAGLTKSFLVGTVISLDTSLPQLATVTMRLSFSVSEETVCEVGLAVETGLGTLLSAGQCVETGAVGCLSPNFS